MIINTENIEHVLKTNSGWHLEKHINMSRNNIGFYKNEKKEITSMSLGAAIEFQKFYNMDVNNMNENIWEFENYMIEDSSNSFYELTFADYDENILGVIVTDVEDDYLEMVRALNNGADPIAEGWEDGGGNTLNINGWGGSPAE